MVRAFVAIELSDEVRESLRAAQDRLRMSTARLNLVDPALAHITLKFLGEVEEERIGAVKDALRGVRGRAYALTVGGVGGNNPRRPRVVWCAVDDGGETVRLAERVEKALGPLGFPRETRAFTPHVTLARVKDFDPSLLEAVRDRAATGMGTCTIDHIALKKSTLTPKGPVYETLLEVPLGEE
jgi:2'-5' RNA ligase